MWNNFVPISVHYSRSGDEPNSGQVFAVRGLDEQQRDASVEFVSCNETRRREYVARYPNHVASGSDGDLVRHKVRKMLFSAKVALDDLGIPFWLSSGTFLGTMRRFVSQCPLKPRNMDFKMRPSLAGCYWCDHVTVSLERSGLPLSENANFNILKSLADPRDHAEVTAWMPVTVSNHFSYLWFKICFTSRRITKHQSVTTLIEIFSAKRVKTYTIDVTTEKNIWPVKT